MSLKEQVLDILESETENFVSGEELAKRLYVSRNAIWKSVKALREDGCEIDAVTNKGYSLRKISGAISGFSVQKLLGENSIFSINTVKKTESTNNAVKEIASKGEKEGYVLIAEHQTKGKGRMGRTFYSPHSSGIYMSILLRPESAGVKLPASKSIYITTAAAIAVCEAVENVAGVSTDIKWVNDILIGGLKVCGILTEGTFDLESAGFEYVVLGIGINVTQPEGGFESEIKDTAGAVFETENSHLNRKKELIVAEILKNFQRYYKNEICGSGKKSFIEKYRQRSYVVGKKIEIIQGEQKIPATATGINDDCSLEVILEDGQTKTLTHGEVSIKIQNRK